MNHAFQITQLQRGELGELAAALASEGLPHDDIGALDCRFLRLHDGSATIGFSGMQGDGPDRLLRSFWLRADRRRLGLGAHLLDLTEREARAAGTLRLHLLTTTAADFFMRHGYARADRRHAPPVISATNEFTTSCPAGAAYLVKSLSVGV